MKALPIKTDGPWNAECCGSRRTEWGAEVPVYEIRNDGGDLVADHVDEGDAFVLAAAMEMFDALERLKLMAEAMDMHDMAWIAEAAIQKATAAS